MRVLHVGKFYPPAPGGMEKVVQLLCEGERRTIDSRVLVANHQSGTVVEEVNGVPVTRVRSLAKIGSVGVCPSFPLHLYRAERDLTVLHEPNPLALVSDFLALQRGPLVLWFHSEVVRPAWKYRSMYRPFLRRVLHRADRIVVSSPPLAEHAAELNDFRAKCVVVPFGIDRSPLQMTPAIAERVNAIKARFKGPVGLFVGRLVPYKGASVLIDALRGQDLSMLIVGTGPLRASLEAQARGLTSETRLHFLGGVDDEELVALYHACDFFVLPSVTRAETFGVVQIEAMACGKPVISTNLQSGVPWVNQDGVSGLVVPPGDPDALGVAIRSLAGNDALRARLGSGAQRRVEMEFTARRMVQRTTALYESVLGDHGRRKAS